MFAPVAFRFLTYGVTEAGAVDKYIQTVTRDALVQAWVQASVEEQEIISSSEAGL